MKKLRLALLTLVPLALAGALWWSLRPDVRPRPIFDEQVSVETLEMSPRGVLSVLWSDSRSGLRVGEIRLDAATGKVLSRQKLKGDMVIDRTLTAEADDGSRVVDHSDGRLTLQSATGAQHDLEIPPQRVFSDLRFSPDGSEVLALVPDELWRYNIRSHEVKEVKPVAIDRNWKGTAYWKTRTEFYPRSWVRIFSSLGPALSPDGQYVAGYDGDLLIFDAHTGAIRQRIDVPSGTDLTTSGGELTLRWCDDGKCILLDGPEWPDVLAIDYPSGRLIRRFYWPHINQPGDYRNFIFLSPGNLFYADVDGKDIVLRDCRLGKITRRARGAAQQNWFPEKLAICPSGDAIFFHPDFDKTPSRIWRWPTAAE